MSAFLVFDEFGSDGSRVVESRHVEAHGEFGVTCNATLNWPSKEHSRTSVKGERDTMVLWD